tara:strand:+ start:17888 stop:18616 length:729 start_codon:yes stop_codon:yes gene_type:complete
MKYITLLILICFLQPANAQDTIIKHFDSNWKEVCKEKANYYRKIFKNNKETWTVCDYYVSDQIQMAGTYKSKKLKKKNGLFEFYYEDGTKKKEGEFFNNKYNGVWKWYHKNGKISSREIYKKNRLKEIECWNEDGSIVEGKIGKIILAEFVGGDSALKDFIATHVIYPLKAQKKGIQGRVLVKFIIGFQGEIEKSWIVEYAHPLLIDEALRVVNSMPNWIPGKAHNLPSKVSFTIPINFRLN